MSYYLTDGTSEPSMVASNLGWSEFTDWAEGAEAEELTQAFIDDGECDNCEGLLNELDALPIPTNKDVKSVLDNILSFLRTEPDQVILSNGMIEDDTVENSEKEFTL